LIKNLHCKSKQNKRKNLHKVFIKTTFRKHLTAQFGAYHVRIVLVY